ncbi:MAG: hypothetical protein C4346_17605, partial [Chloroflexota bacterium]
RLLAMRGVNGEHIVVQEAVPGRPVGTRLTAAHQRLLAALASGPARPAATSALLTELPCRLAALPDKEAPVRPVLSWATRVLQSTMLPRTILHGDFAPWNLRWWHGTLVAFDWEYARCDGVPLLDEVHHTVQVGFLLRGWTASQALAKLAQQARSGRHGLRPEEIEALQAIYLLDAFARRHEEGYPREDRLLKHYRDMLDRVAARPEVATA